MQPKHTQIIDPTISQLQNGIDKQREIFKTSNLESHYELMAKSIQNIKSEIKSKAKQKKLEHKIKEIEDILDQYNTLEQRYTKKTPSGTVFKPPKNIDNETNKQLNLAYELIIEILNLLDLI